MSTCTVCGCFAPGDPDTGYDADSLCPSCQADGFTETIDGVIVNVLHDEDETDPFLVAQGDPRRT